MYYVYEWYKIDTNKNYISVKNLQRENWTLIQIKS